MSQGHTVTINPSDEHVEVRIGDLVLASTDHPLRLDETGLPTRFYLPPADVRLDLLRKTSFHTTCPYKGEASYWSVEAGGRVHDDVVWSYETPIAESEQITGLLCFYTERGVDVTVTPAGER